LNGQNKTQHVNTYIHYILTENTLLWAAQQWTVTI